MSDAAATDLADPRVLVGTWRLDRTVEDRRAGERHALDGTLRISVDGERLRWEERLVWHRETGDVEAHRELALERREDGWWVLFDDGRDFHPWTPGERVVHPCTPDTYAGVVTGRTERWTITWKVEGPAKDYTMTSVMTGPLTPR